MQIKKNSHRSVILFSHFTKNLPMERLKIHCDKLKMIYNYSVPAQNKVTYKLMYIIQRHKVFDVLSFKSRYYMSFVSLLVKYL